MQIVRIQTNIRNVDIPEKFEKELIYQLETITGLPADKILIMIEPAIRMLSGKEGRETPIAFITITSTRPSSQAENDEFAKKINVVLKDQLKLDSDGIIIVFDYKDAKSMAIQGKTIASLYS